MKKSVLLLILILILVYANSFQNKFVWDDSYLIVKNPSITSWKFAWIHFAIDLYHSYSNYYRPMQMISYTQDFSLWRLNVFGYHLTNLFFHILVCIEALFLFRLITKDARAALCGALLFAVHPVNVGSVTYIAGRADSMATLFMLASIILLHGHFKANRKVFAIYFYIASLAGYILALLSKETALILPLMLFFYRRFFIPHEDTIKSRSVIKFHYMSGFVIILAVYAILRVGALNFYEYAIPLSRHSLYSRMLTSVEAIGQYFSLIVFPFDLRMERSIPYAQTLFQKDVLITLALVVLMIILFTRRKRTKASSFGIAFFIVAMVPIMNIYPMSDNMAEHWLYMPMVGAALFAGSTLIRIWDQRRSYRGYIATIFSVYLIFLSLRTVDRNRDWRDEETMYLHTYTRNPESIKILNNLGNMYHDRGDYRSAVSFHEKALAINPREYRSLYNLGRDYEQMGLIKDALRQYEKSIDIRPDYAKAYLRLGNLYTTLKNYDLAKVCYEDSIRYDDLLVESHIKLGDLYYELKDFDIAANMYLQALRVNPGLPEAQNDLGNVYFRLGRIEEAAEFYERAVDLAPKKFECLLNLGVTYGKMKRYEDALCMFEQAQRIDPLNVDAMINIGVVYYQTGRRSEARDKWEEALVIQPQNQVALAYLNTF